MPVGAVRYGLTDDPVELDLRIQRIEAALLKRQQANIESGTQAVRVSYGQALPQVGGVSLNNNIIGGIGVSWRAVLNPDLSYYEVQFSLNDQFTSDQTATQRIAGGVVQAIYGGAEPGVPYYVRVRAVSNSPAVEPGPWSSVFNTETGEATYNHLAVGAASAITSDLILEDAFDPAIIGSGVSILSATYGAALISVAGGGVVIPSTIVMFEYRASYGGGGDDNRLTATFLRDEKPIDQGQWDFGIDTAGEILRLTLSGFSTPDQPLTGNHVYSIQYDITYSGSSQLDIWMKRQQIELIEYVR